jgi:hypothetical protein
MASTTYPLMVEHVLHLNEIQRTAKNRSLQKKVDTEAGVMRARDIGEHEHDLRSSGGSSRSKMMFVPTT